MGTKDGQGATIAYLRGRRRWPSSTGPLKSEVPAPAAVGRARRESRAALVRISGLDCWVLVRDEGREGGREQVRRPWAQKILELLLSPGAEKGPDTTGWVVARQSEVSALFRHVKSPERGVFREMKGLRTAADAHFGDEVRTEITLARFRPQPALLPRPEIG